MRCTTLCSGVFVVIGVAAALSADAAFAESPSAILEKAIYTEETVGDLDAAAKLYQQAIAEAKQVDAVAAKAQYRLGLCLLKQGKKKRGIAALEEVVKRYPEQKEIVAAARKHLPPKPGLTLLPVPWADGETLHHRMELGGGLEIGTVIYSVRSTQRDGQKIWRFKTRLFAAGRQMASCVDARFDDLRPISSIWNIGGVSNVTTQYEAGKIVVTTKTAGKDTPRTIEVDPVPYDNEEGVFLFRCLPIAENYKTKVPVFASIGSGQAIEVGYEPQGKESVSTPAGKFDCVKVLLPTPINQTFWYTTDEHRYFVKLEANNVLAFLTKIETRKPGDSQKYENSDLGVSLTLPPDWYAYHAANKAIANSVWLLDPDAEWNVVLKTTKLEKLSKEERESPRAWAEKGLPNAAKQLKDLKVRDDSWQPTTIAGLPAVSFAGDYVATDGRPMTQFVVCVFGKTTAANINADCPRDGLERMKQSLLPIVESLEVK